MSCKTGELWRGKVENFHAKIFLHETVFAIYASKLWTANITTRGKETLRLIEPHDLNPNQDSGFIQFNEHDLILHHAAPSFLEIVGRSNSVLRDRYTTDTRRWEQKFKHLAQQNVMSLFPEERRHLFFASTSDLA